MEETTEIQVLETVNVKRDQLDALLKQNRELKQMTSATTDLILFAVSLIGGRIPTSKAQIFMLLGKIPSMMNGIQAQDMHHLEAIKNTIVQIAPAYLSPEQMEKLLETGLLELINTEKND